MSDVSTWAPDPDGRTCFVCGRIMRIAPDGSGHACDHVDPAPPAEPAGFCGCGDRMQLDICSPAALIIARTLRQAVAHEIFSDPEINAYIAELADEVDLQALRKTDTAGTLSFGLI